MSLTLPPPPPTYTPPHSSMPQEVPETPALRTHLSVASWDLLEKSEKLPLVFSAANSMKFSLGWVDNRRLLSDWMEKFTVR